MIFDPYATAKSKDQIKSYVSSKGYFDGQVSETIATVKQKTDVYYNVDLRPPYTIRNIYNEIADSNIKKLYLFDSMNCVIERGKPYDVDVFRLKDRDLRGLSRTMDFMVFREIISISGSTALLGTGRLISLWSQEIHENR